MTKIGSLNIEGRESRRLKQVNCDAERSVPTQCDWVVDKLTGSLD